MVERATVRDGDRERCTRCGETWDRHSTQAVTGHVCESDIENLERDARFEALEHRIETLESQVRSLQVAMPKGIDHG